MKLAPTLIFSTALGLCTLSAHGQEAIDTPEPEAVRLSVDKQHPSQPKSLSVREQRQIIAQEKARLRRARMARNAWHGHHPLRPVATDLPFMRSNYVHPAYRYSFLPVYYR